MGDGAEFSSSLRVFFCFGPLACLLQVPPLSSFAPIAEDLTDVALFLFDVLLSFLVVSFLSRRFDTQIVTERL